MNLLMRASITKHKKYAIATAIICVLAALPGCGIPKLRNPLAARELPDTFNGEVSSENSSQVSVEEFFGDPLLLSLLDQGLNGSLQLKILNENIEIANNEVLRRRGAYLPFVTLGGRAGVEKPSAFTPLGQVDDQLQYFPGHTFPTPLPNFLVAANVSWQVDIWRQLRNSRDAQALRFLGTTDGRNYVVTRLVADIAENYYRLMALDKTMENLDRTISLQEKSLEFAIARKEGARGTELAVQRFRAEVRRNQSEKLIIRQDIIETENQINYLVGRYPEPVQRSTEFFDLNLHPLSVGVPCDLLLNRPDIRMAERELEAAGLDVLVARADFYPKLNLYAGVGYEAFNAKYLFMTPQSLIYNAVGDLTAPLINKRAIQAEYMNANARQLQALYDYQRTVLNAFTEVINRMSKVKNYSESLAIKKEQLDALEASVVSATSLFQGARVEYMDVLFAQRDLRDARTVYIDTKKEQLSAVVNTYQALGGGLVRSTQFIDGGMIVTPPPSLPSPTPAMDGPAPTPSPDKADTSDKTNKTDDLP
jgi:multidrug efflux system outer membrane protein